MTGGAGEGAMDLDGMPSLGFDDVELEMLAAGPAEVQYNEIMEKDVLQYFGLYGTHADAAAAGTATAAAAGPASTVAGSTAGSGGSGGSGGGSGPGSRGGSFIGAQMLLGGGNGIGHMLLGGSSGIGSSLLLGGASGVGGQLLLAGGGGAAPAAVGSAAQHVEALLAGTHPSMRGGTLADWLSAEGPIVSLTVTGLPDQQQGQHGAGLGGQARGAEVQLLNPQASAVMGGSSRGGAAASPAARHPTAAGGQARQAAQQLQFAQAQQAQQAHQLQFVQAQQAQQAQHAQQAQQAQPMMLQLPGGAPLLHPALFAGSGGAPPQPLSPTSSSWMQQAAAPEQQQQQHQAMGTPFFGQAAPPVPHYAPGGHTVMVHQQGSMQLQQPQGSVQLQQPQGSVQLPERHPSAAALPVMLADAIPPSPVSSSGAAAGQPAARQAPDPLLPMLSAADLPTLPVVAPPPARSPMPGAAPALSDGGGEASGLSGGGEAGAARPAHPQPSNKRFSDRQKAKISNLEAELNKLQESMAQVKLENERLKSKNLEVEEQLRTQEQLQQLAAVAGAQAAANAAPLPAGEDGAAGALPSAARAPPLGAAVGLSPPNSQRKLLAHLSVSMRPADREMRAVATLTWPKLQEWYAQLVARFGEVVAQTPSLGPEEADAVAKEALKAGRYWDLLVLISRPDLSTQLLHDDLASGLPEAVAAAAAAAAAPLAPPPGAAGGWAAAALGAMQLSGGQRDALAGAWRRHREAAEQRAQRKQELLTAIRQGFLQPLQRAAPEDVELGKPLAAQGLEAMEALRLVVRQDHVSAVQLACGVRKLLSPLQQARLALAAWPRYPDPSKWAPQLLEQLPQQGPE